MHQRMQRVIDPKIYPGDELEIDKLAVNYHRGIYSIFRPCVGKNILEVGSGIGTFTRLLIESNVEQIYALEPSKFLFPLLQKNLNNIDKVQTFNRSLEDYINSDLPRDFDTAVLVNVLEHIPDDLSALNTLFQILRPHGHLLIFVPALMLLYGAHDERVGHCRRYTKKELSSKCEQSGFKVKELYYFDFLGAPLWFIQTKILKRTVQQMSPNLIKLFDAYVYPITLSIEKRLKPLFGKNLIAICEKP